MKWTPLGISEIQRRAQHSPSVRMLWYVSYIIVHACMSELAWLLNFCFVLAWQEFEGDQVAAGESEQLPDHFVHPVEDTQPPDPRQHLLQLQLVSTSLTEELSWAACMNNKIIIAAEWAGAERQNSESAGEQYSGEDFDHTSITRGATGRNRSTTTPFAGTISEWMLAACTHTRVRVTELEY